MKRHPELRGKALLFLLFLWFLWFINFGIRVIFSPILPLIEDEFMISHARASSIFIFQSAGYGLSVLCSGFYAGRLGYKKSIVLSLCASSCIFFLIPYVKVFSLLYLFNTILGLSIGMYIPSAIPLITDYFAEKDWGKSIAVHDSGSSISIFCIPFIALFLLHFVTWRGIFEVFAVVFILSAFVFYFTADEVKTSHSEKAVFQDITKMGSLWIQATLWVFAAGVTLGIYFITPLYLTKELSMGIGSANTILGVSRIGAVFVAIMAGFFIDKINLRKAMFTMMLVAGALTVFIGFASVRFIGIFLFLQALCVTGFFPVGLVFIARTFSKEQRGMATGFIVALSITFGGGVIPNLLGLSGDYLGFRFGIVVLGAITILSSFLAFSLKELRQTG